MFFRSFNIFLFLCWFTNIINFIVLKFLIIYFFAYKLLRRMRISISSKEIIASESLWLRSWGKVYLVDILIWFGFSKIGIKLLFSKWLRGVSLNRGFWFKWRFRDGSNNCLVLMWEIVFSVSNWKSVDNKLK